MKSTIRVDFSGLDNQENAFEPILRVNLQDSDDTRDRLLRSFFQALGGESNWLHVNFSDFVDVDKNYQNIVISPVKPSQLQKTKQVIDNRLGLSEQLLPSRFQIDDGVDFTTPKAKDYAFEEAKNLPENKGKKDGDIEYIPEYFWGKVVAVKFTKAKVWYDILDDYSGKVFENIPSHDTKKLAEEFSAKNKVGAE